MDNSRFHFKKERINTTGEWYAGVECKDSSLIDTKTIIRRLHDESPEVGVRKLEELFNRLCSIILREIAKGNIICLFELLTLRPKYRLTQSYSGNETYVENVLPKLTDDDVAVSIRATPMKKVEYQFKKLLADNRN